MDLANTNADPSTGQHPNTALWDPSVGADPVHSTTYALARPTQLSTIPDHPVGVETRPALGFITTFTRPWHLWRRLGGNHGVIPTPPAAPNIDGAGRQPWRNWNPRTLRNMPAEAWDAGTEVGT